MTVQALIDANNERRDNYTAEVLEAARAQVRAINSKPNREDFEALVMGLEVILVELNAGAVSHRYTYENDYDNHVKMQTNKKY
jgi:hypothetical protein